ncbi:MAG: SOS response-associated peptidase [Flavobacteriales bacterium]
MCGRYVTVSKLTTIEKRFNVKATQPDHYVVNTNVSHGNLAPVITGHQPSELQFFQFGFTPSWAKKQFYMINARGEGDFNKEDSPNYSGQQGIVNKPMFRKSIRSQRCLVVADAFIEGPKKEKLSQPYVVYLKDKKRPFSLAGIWDEWVNQSTGEVVKSFAIITTVPNGVMDKIGHHRSPVVLHARDEKHWINPELPLSEVTALLKSFPTEEMNAYPISSNIKNPRANGLELLDPIGERVFPEYDYKIEQDLKLYGMGESPARARKNEERE